MSYVTHITATYGGQTLTDGVACSLEPGDFPGVRYDLERIAAEVDRDALAAGPASLWRYHALLPAERPEAAVTLGEGWTPMLPVPRIAAALGLPRLWAKDEGRNPSGTFKDRGASVAVTRLRELGIDRVIHASSGNAAGAWALYAARAGIACTNLVPDDVTAASLGQSLLAGADTAMLDGPWQVSGAMVSEAAGAGGAFNVATLREPHRLEGKKTMGVEIAQQLGWRLPDVIVYPTGGGLGAIAIYKALEELQALGWIPPGPLPRLVVTQYRGCAPLVRAFEAGQTLSEPWMDLDVPPGGLKSTRPPGDRAVLDLLRSTGGTAVAVEGHEAIDAAAALARDEGLFVCPEAGTTLAGLRKAIECGAVQRSEEVVLMLTGTGLKSVSLLPQPAPRRLQAGEAIAPR